MPAAYHWPSDASGVVPSEIHGGIRWTWLSEPPTWCEPVVRSCMAYRLFVFHLTSPTAAVNQMSRTDSPQHLCDGNIMDWMRPT